MTSGFIPYGKQSINDDDIKAVIDVLKSDWLTTGPAVEAFEKALGDYVHAPHVVVCANGTAALHLAAMALNLDKSCAVIVPAVTFLATASAPQINGAEIVFCDVDPETGLMTADSLQAAIDTHEGKPLKAVFPVHLAGQPCDMPTIQETARKYGLLVIEDACHALGARYQSEEGEDHFVGACDHSDLCVYSFHPVKNIATGEGGALTTTSPSIDQALRKLRNHAMTRSPGDWINLEMAFDEDGHPNPWYYEITRPGLNYRLSDINAALGTSQLKRAASMLERRHELVGLYKEALAALDAPIRFVPQRAGTYSGMHLFAVLIDFEQLSVSRASVMQQLHEQGVGTQVHYIPVSDQPYFRSKYGAIHLPGAQQYYARTLSLPLFAAMTEYNVGKVVEVLRSVLRQPS